ncbi:hypothetical protein M9H77_22237 [Catharanthus roseus]|uniref:Uncharacterized protein n=1 Tax=Catharanthus roseus TaxID=4058 RepID=A0ACC0AQU0_CATRO|nr:hypothetical protein M9H77_22237 [Catharanthus roseus]
MEQELRGQKEKPITQLEEMGKHKKEKLVIQLEKMGKHRNHFLLEFRQGREGKSGQSDGLRAVTGRGLERGEEKKEGTPATVGEQLSDKPTSIEIEQCLVSIGVWASYSRAGNPPLGFVDIVPSFEGRED